MTVIKKGTWESGAEFSECGLYRYSLHRCWTPGTRKWMVMIGLNPSTATHEVTDATIRKVTTFAKRELCGGFVMLNLFGLRSRDPKNLFEFGDPVGPENNEVIARWLSLCPDRQTVAWGAHKMAMPRARDVVENLLSWPLNCFGVTKDGHPKHPLYLASNTPLVAWPGYREELHELKAPL